MSASDRGVSLDCVAASVGGRFREMEQRLIEHRKRVVNTIRDTARWREQVGVKYSDRNSKRAAHYLWALAKFCERDLDDTDPLLATTFAWSGLSGDGSRYLLCRRALNALSRFGFSRDTHECTTPRTEQFAQILGQIERYERHASGQPAGDGRTADKNYTPASKAEQTYTNRISVRQ